MLGKAGRAGAEISFAFAKPLGVIGLAEEVVGLGTKGLDRLNYFPHQLGPFEVDNIGSYLMSVGGGTLALATLLSIPKLPEAVGIVQRHLNQRRSSSPSR